MPNCRNHPNKSMFIKGDKWVCLECDYQLDIKHKVLSHQDALEELERLRQEYNELYELAVYYCSTKDALQEFINQANK